MVVDSIDNLYAPMTYTKIAGFMLLRFMGILVVLMKNYKCPWNKSALPVAYIETIFLLAIGSSTGVKVR